MLFSKQVLNIPFFTEEDLTMHFDMYSLNKCIMPSGQLSIEVKADDRERENHGF